MKKIWILFPLLWLIGSNCKKEQALGSTCFHGKVILSSCCTGSTFIALDGSQSIGRPMKYNDTLRFNVIQIPGYHPLGDAYLIVRPYNAATDQNLFPPIECYCLVAIGLNAPIYVPVTYSQTACVYDVPLPL